jgi:uncharacterized protein
LKYTVFLTQRCNMSCRYCYGGDGGTDIDDETAFRAVDLAFELVPDGESLDFGFFGGEPILRFDLIRKVTARVRKKERECGVKTVLSLTSNGTIMNADILRFLKNEGVGYCVSLDGPPEVHDRYRVFGTGGGSFRSVVGNLSRAIQELPSVSINAVFGPETLASLATTADYLLSFGVPVYLNWDIVTPWSQESLSRAEEIFQQVGEIYVDYVKAGSAVTLHPIEDKVILFLAGGYSDGDKCRIGEGEWAVAVNGDVYPCERLVGNAEASDLIMGNVETGVDEAKRRAVIENRGNRNDECTACSFKDFCVNWCGCTNWFMTGRTNYAGPVSCRLERATIKAAKVVFEELKRDPTFHEYLAKVFAPGCSECNKEASHGWKHQRNGRRNHRR